MNPSTIKVTSAIVLACVALVGSMLSLKAQSSGSPAKMHVVYAFAGGILIAVAMVHMLSESSGELEEAGVAFSKAFGGDGEEAFPLGTLLFVCGFALIVIIESLLHHKLGAGCHGHGHGAVSSSPDQGDARERLGVQSTEAELDQGDARERLGVQSREASFASAAGTGGANAGGWAALTGLSIHSVVEGIAAGSVKGAADVSFVILAIACHKGFAAFALGAANLPLHQGGQRLAWHIVTMWFALSGSLGIIIGMIAQADVDGPTAAGITCVAAGTLLSVGINEMIMPALADGQLLTIKLVSLVLGMLGMSILAVWA